MSDSAPEKSTDTTVSMLPERGMITIRGDLNSQNLISAIREVVNIEVPTPGQFNISKKQTACLWMSPDELLILIDPEDVHSCVDTMQRALLGEHSLVSIVSDARAIFQIRGPDARDVLAKLTPANLSPSVFRTGNVRRSRIAQVAGAFWMVDIQTIELVCFRSTSGYMMGLLEQASRLGSEPKFH